MWPWEHVAFGYVCYSLYRHARFGASPGDRAALLAAFGAVLPDLVDKPLSWGLGWFPQGYAVAHSAFVLVAAAAVVLLVRRFDPAGLGTALLVGWASHLFGDVVYPAMLGGRLAFRRVLWPLVTLPPYHHHLGLLARAVHYLHEHAVRTLAGGLGVALGLEIAFVVLAVGLWLHDGTPGRWRHGSPE